MNQYNFNILSPLEFEEFSKDILSAVHNVEYQTFRDGKDGGIDIRYVAENRKSKTIVQCKRYKSSPGLMNNLLKKERPKLDRLKPKRYILMLSLDLSVRKVDDLVKAFKPYLRSSHDVIMPKQLNSYLADHPQVEKRHFKLWLTSANVLDIVVRSGIENYSELTRKNIEDSVALFAPLPNMQEAIDKLRDNGFIIITGQPGVGKTTLAMMMAYELLGDKENGFTEFISIPRDFNDVLTKLSTDPKKHQVFYFDDFLGTNFLEQKLDRREDSVFHELVTSAQKLRKTKVLIMTTRDYILQQAGRSSRYFDDQSISQARYIVNLDNYGLELKSRILYNHVANFDLPEAHLEFFLNNKVYKKLIQHRNYSPRLIEGIGQYKMWIDTTPSEFCDKLVASFDNPSQLYKHAYESEIDAIARDLLLVLMSIGVSVRLPDLYTAVKAYNHCDNNTFHEAIDILDGTFIKTDMREHEITISFSNPSVHDFLVEYYRKRSYALSDLLQKAVFLNQLIHVFARRQSNINPRRLFGDSMRQFGNMFFDRIIVDEQIAAIIEQRLLDERQRLPLIKSSGRVENYADDLFDRATRLTNEEITSNAISEAALNDIKMGLLENKINSASINDVLYIYEYYAEAFSDDKIVLEKLADLIAANVQSFEDLSLLYDLSQNSKHAAYITQVTDLVVEYGNVDAIIDQEISDRLSDESPESVVTSVLDVSNVYGICESQIWFRIHSQIDSSDVEAANFYNKVDHEYEVLRGNDSDRDSMMDNIFDSLRS